MNHLFIRSITLALTFFSATAQAGPRFDEYKVEIFTGQNHAAVITKENRKMRTRLTDLALGPVNFAGHYSATEYGCGMSCILHLVVSIKTGIELGGDLPPALTHCDEDRQWESYSRPDSRLLIVAGKDADGEPGCFTRYYEEVNGTLKLIKKEPFLKSSTAKLITTQSITNSARAEMADQAKAEDLAKRKQEEEQKIAAATERNKRQQAAQEQAEATRAAGNGNEKVASAGVDAGVPPSLYCIFEREPESHSNAEVNFFFSPDGKFARYFALLTETGVRMELSGQWAGGTWSWQNNRLVLAVTTTQNDGPKGKEAFSIVEKNLRSGKDRLDKLESQRVSAIQDDLMNRPTMKPFRAQSSLTQIESRSDFLVYQMTERREGQSESASRIRCNLIRKEKLVNIDKLMATIFGHSR